MNLTGPREEIVDLIIGLVAAALVIVAIGLLL